MRALNDRQREVLEWIGDGTPERDWPDYTHRGTAKALQWRGLVKVRGHGPDWAAELTDMGRDYLAGTLASVGPYPRGQVRGASQVPTRDKPSFARASQRDTRPSISGEALLQRLLDAGGTVRITDPDRLLRAAYRRALSAISAMDLPDDKRVTYRGRDNGDLVIELVDRPAGESSPLTHVPVPDQADPEDPVIRDFLECSELLDVSESTRARALRLLQAITQEAARRGYDVRHRPGDPGVDLLVHAEPLTVVVSEAKDKVSRVSDEDRAKVKYDWQRAQPTTVVDWAGRLAMTLQTGLATDVSAPRWADRKRWTVESRLPHLFARAEEAAKARIDHREARERARQDRRREWEEAVPRARQRYLDDRYRKRLDSQIEAFTRARSLRAYADAVEARVDGASDTPEAVTISSWAQWIRSEADRADPTSVAGNLRYEVPEDVPPWEVGRYMPHGWSITRPPD